MNCYFCERPIRSTNIRPNPATCIGCWRKIKQEHTQLIEEVAFAKRMSRAKSLAFKFQLREKLSTASL